MLRKQRILSREQKTKSGHKEIARFTASGSALVQKLDIALADESISTQGGSIASNSAVIGTAIFPAATNEFTVQTTKITPKSLIYITPVSSTDNQVLYVKQKNNDGFTIAVDSPVDRDIRFNWWIIN